MSWAPRGAAVWIVVAAVFFLLVWEVDPHALREQWVFVLLAVVVAMGLLFVRDIRSILLRLSPDAQNVVVVASLGGAPCLLALLQLSPAVQGVISASGMRVAFACSLTALPGVLYYSSAAARRRSALNDLIVSFRRFGLITTSEMMCASKRRVESYLQQFEAIHGTFPDRDKLIRDLFEGRAEQADSLAVELHLGVLRAMPRPMLVHLLLMVSLLTIGWGVVYPPVQGDVASPLLPERSLFNAAFIGAYVYILVTMITRWIRHDLNIQACIAATKQLVLAMLGAAILTMMGEDGGGDGRLAWYSLSTAIIIGVFPNQMLHLITLVYYKTTNQKEHPSKSAAALSKLDGVSLWNEARLQEEGIDDIHSLACADLIELTMRTRLQPDQVVDWVDQALLKSRLIHCLDTYEHLLSRSIAKATDLVGALRRPECLLIDPAHMPLARAVAERLVESRTAFNEVMRWRVPPTRLLRLPQ